MNVGADPSFPHAVYGWRLDSGVPLPLLPPWQEKADHPPEIVVEFGAIEAPKSPLTFQGPFLSIHADGQVLVGNSGNLRLLVSGGRRIRVEGERTVSSSELQTYLLGVGLGILCHQRGFPPLHAGGVQGRSGTLAIVGRSGDGKSTALRALTRRGFALVADDQILVDPADRMVRPSFPSLKLWRTPSDLLGDPVSDDQRVAAHTDKYHIDMRACWQPAPAPLAAIVVLEWDEGSSGPRLARLPAKDAAPLLHRHTYRLAAAHRLGYGPALFAWATALARQVPVHVLSRPRDLALLEAQTGLLAAVADGL